VFSKSALYFKKLTCPKADKLDDAPPVKMLVAREIIVDQLICFSFIGF
jgi:hypothetical protein